MHNYYQPSNINTSLILQERVYFLSGIALGMAVHFKIYPIMYSLPMYMALSDYKSPSWFVNRFWPNSARVRLVLGTVSTLLFLTGICYAAYGQEFLQEAYLHHVSRRDTRHNFSVYFYMLYLTYEDDDVGISLLTFLPQVKQPSLLMMFKKPPYCPFPNLSFTSVPHSCC